MMLLSMDIIEKKKPLTGSGDGRDVGVAGAAVGTHGLVNERQRDIETVREISRETEIEKRIEKDIEKRKK